VILGVVLMQARSSRAEGDISLPSPSYLLPVFLLEANESRARGPGCWHRIPGCDKGCEDGGCSAEAGGGAQMLGR
jgi:hypothetical protein